MVIELRKWILADKKELTELCNADASHVVKLMRMNYETMRLFRLTRDERNRITDIIIGYYRLHVAAFPELKSLSVVRELWAD